MCERFSVTIYIILHSLKYKNIKGRNFMDKEVLEKLTEIADLYDDNITKKILKKNPHITFGEFLKARDKYTEDKEKRRDLIDLGLIVINGILIAVSVI